MCYSTHKIRYFMEKGDQFVLIALVIGNITFFRDSKNDLGPRVVTKLT